MLDAVRRLCRVVAQEGVTGAINRVRYRRDDRLMREISAPSGQPMALVGHGPLKARFQAELARHGLLAAASAGCRSIVFNPGAAELGAGDLAAAVLDDDYLAAAGPQDGAIQALLASGCAMIVGSEEGLRRALALGAALPDITLVPDRAPGHQTRLAIGRWLAYAGALDPARYLEEVLAFAPPIGDRAHICISLPEYLQRRDSFRQGNPAGFRFFDGIRLLPAWKGCAWSYKTVAAKALQSGAERLTICEDDAFFSPDFPQYCAAIHRYLDRADWDVFNGVMTRIEGKPKISLRRRLGDNHIIHTPHMMGMVFNVYNRIALEWMADWSPDAGDASTNTIDEWLNSMPGLRVVSAVPFIAGHREDVHSTIFGFKNQRYSGMIRATEREILSQVESR
ncbi:hypothetical protein NM680_17215 [Paracoccus sp. PS-1]|uniref:hypothetical protein n=1 Tax=unclassified Paracoccus (in: a-proteobacteria) TaxID=2688777 RepID=UPI0012EB4320|nr:MULTISPECIES: hypothetical protein [unclassified Paracoccus (in: a-proteobacteria)]MDQ7263541.1 hypothetical protein [Paracoccus sp. PS1]